MVWAVYKVHFNGDVLVRLYDRQSLADRFAGLMGTEFYVRPIEVYAAELMEG